MGRIKNELYTVFQEYLDNLTERRLLTGPIDLMETPVEIKRTKLPRKLKKKMKKNRAVCFTVEMTMPQSVTGCTVDIKL